MANVKLVPADLQPEALPAVCAYCGSPATGWVTKRLAATSWILPLPGGFVVTGKSAEVSLPFCKSHRKHWARFTLIAGLGILALLLLAAATVLCYVQGMTETGEFFLIAFVVGVAVWLVLVAVWQQLLIRAGKIGQDGIVLTGVSRSFRDAVLARRSGTD